MIEIAVRPAEEGSAEVTIACTDTRGQPVVPTQLRWTLTDADGVAINGRSLVAVTPGLSTSWLIYGADLAIGEAAPDRVLTIDATYDSTLGSGIPARAQAQFSIERFVVAAP